MPAATRVGDKSQCPADAHGCPGCPHGVIGPAVSGSPDVFINSKPALRVGDPGIHAACCGPNTWKAIQGSPNVFINGKPAHRLGDADQHCGGIGRMIEGSPNVFINEIGSGDANTNIQGEQDLFIGGSEKGSGLGTTTEGGHDPTIKVISTLGPDVDTLVSKSPTLSNQILKLHQEKWKIRYGMKGSGSFCERKGKLIEIDSNKQGNPAKVTRSLAHEAGHASFSLQPEVQPEGLTKEQYISLNMQIHLDNEGEAILNTCIVREEILSNGGPDIGIGGDNEDKYKAICADYMYGGVDRKTARDAISSIVGDEIASGTGEAYKDRWRMYYEKKWDSIYGGVR